MFCYKVPKTSWGISSHHRLQNCFLNRPNLAFGSVLSWGTRFNVWLLNISMFFYNVPPSFCSAKFFGVVSVHRFWYACFMKNLNNAWWASFLDCIGHTCMSPKSVTNIWAVLLPLVDLIPNIVSVYNLPRNLQCLYSDWRVLNRHDNDCNTLWTALWVFVDTTSFALSIPMPHIWASFWVLVFGSLSNDVTLAKYEAILDTVLILFLSIAAILALVATAFKRSFCLLFSSSFMLMFDSIESLVWYSSMSLYNYSSWWNRISLVTSQHHIFDRLTIRSSCYGLALS